MTKRVALKHTTATNLKVAELALAKAFSEAALVHLDYTEKSPDEFDVVAKLRFSTPTTHDEHKTASVLIRWPDGQAGHGSAAVSLADGYAFPLELKFACWRNEDDSLAVELWSGPDLMHEFHQKYGVPYPRGWKPDSIGSFGMSVCGIAALFAFFMGIDVLWARSFFETDVGRLLVYVSGLVLGFLFGLLIAWVHAKSRSMKAERAWHDDELRVDKLNAERAAKASSTAA